MRAGHGRPGPPPPSLTGQKLLSVGIGAAVLTKVFVGGKGHASHFLGPGRDRRWAAPRAGQSSSVSNMIHRRRPWALLLCFSPRRGREDRSGRSWLALLITFSCGRLVVLVFRLLSTPLLKVALGLLLALKNFGQSTFAEYRVAVWKLVIRTRTSRD